jgi:4'-phosphopantetheinyl transferase
VDVWLTSLHLICANLERAYLDLLSEAERAKWQRFVPQDARLQYLASRALVRTTLSRYAEVPERAWQFSANSYGRPHVLHPRDARSIRFNLSNTSGLVVCVIARDCDVGIDVENITRSVDVDRLSPAVFASTELADVRGRRASDRRERFFSYWTLKEAYIKARGMGLSIPLDSFWFDLGGSAPSLHVAEDCHDDPKRWRFYQYAPTSEHRMALAAAAPPDAQPDIRLRWITPLSAQSA